MSIFDIDYSKNKPIHLDHIFFGMGCFWGAERKFWSLSGLFTTAVGYAGGHMKNPNYEKVCSGETGHAEVVKVIYDNKKTTLEDLLKIFWESHDPTQLNRQGNDIGTQYRSMILSDDKDQLPKLEDSKKKFQEKLDLKKYGSIKTEIKLLSKFFLAEDYHQKYLHKNPNGYCGLKGLGVKYA